MGTSSRHNPPAPGLSGGSENGLRRSPARLPIAVFVVLALAIATAGYLTYVHEARGIRSEVQADLGAIADLKATQLQSWLAALRGDARALALEAGRAVPAGAWAPSGALDEAPRAQLVRVLDGFREAHGFRAAFVLRPGGDLLVAVPPARHGPLPPEARALLAQVQAEGSERNSDLHAVDGGGGPVGLGVAAPVRLTESGPVAGSVYIDVDPVPYFSSLLSQQVGPRESASSETVLVRREGDSVVFLNELRGAPGPPLRLRLPLSTPGLGAARAVTGYSGAFEGVDYRGVSVLGAIRQVKGTGWALVAKVDAEEIQAPLRRLWWGVVGLGLVLAGAAGSSVGLWWRAQKAAHAAQLSASLAERRALERHFHLVTRDTNDIFLLADPEGRIVDANDRAVAAYGWPPEQLRGLSLRDLLGGEDREVPALSADAAEGRVYESLHRRRDGSTFPVEVSVRAVEVDGRAYRHCAIRDLTERKHQEERIRRLDSLYATLSHTNQTIVRLADAGTLCHEVCRVAVGDGGFLAASLDRWGPGGQVVPVARHARAGSPPGAAVPTLVALREDRLQVGPAGEGWSAEAQAAAFPLSVGGERWTLTLVGSEPFDQERVDLLAEMAEDVGYALANLAHVERERAAEAAVAEWERRFRGLIEQTALSAVILDPGGRVVFCNDAFLRVTGRSREAVLGQDWFDLFLPAPARPGARGIFQQTVPAGTPPARWVSPVLTAGGEERTLAWTNVVLRDQAGHPSGTASLGEDITERLRAEERMRLWSGVMESAAEAIMITDAAGRILSVNRAFAEITGYALSEVAGQTPSSLEAGRTDPHLAEDMARALSEGGYWSGEVWYRRRDGRVYPAWLSLSAVRDGQGTLTHQVGIFTDISERKASAERIQYLSSHDFLTGLPNRALFDSLVDQALSASRRQGRRFAVLLLDLDHFKTVNDSLGHQVGDKLVQAVAERLRKCVRAGDTVARQGGDEFLMILVGVDDAGGAARACANVLRAFRDPFTVEGRALGASASLGVALAPDDGADPATLVRNADAAMYQAKRDGRNQFRFFAPALNAQASAVLSLESDLRRALDQGELVLEYQPQVDVVSGRILGAEALARWRHPERGLVSPGEFIPFAEERGLIVPIGEWVLRTACAQARKWQKDGLPAIPVAVNLSALHFRQPGLAETIAAILQETGLDPSLLELELTEGVAMHDADASVSLMSRLGQMGVRLAIDDFGTGYSSLSYLSRFPIHRLKIDRSFVRDVPDSAEASAIALAIVGLARSLRIGVIAEGVETQAQLRFLREHGCDEAQGYLLSPPLAPPEMAERLRLRGQRLTV